MLSTLQAHRARIPDIDAEIPLLGLEPSLSRLGIEKMLAKRLDYKYPVLTLPNEVVSEIFTLPTDISPLPTTYWASLPEFFDTHLSRMAGNSTSHPRALESYSIIWRCHPLQMTNPLVSVPATTSPKLGCRGRLALRLKIYTAGIWLTRSRSAHFPSIGEHGVHTPEIFTAVMSHCDRWEYLKFSLLVSQLPTFDGRFIGFIWKTFFLRCCALNPLAYLWSNPSARAATA
ncbi:hypothetical protein B0H19DRAFT_1288330 [Mycena capillaripes]|nr:hypothetical protein B0H19DRAFT_1288330 [Mycena capillaripes]